MKKAILILVALVIVSLPVWANEPSFVDDGYYHYYKIVGLRLDMTGKAGVEEARTLLLLLVSNAYPSEISRWRLDAKYGLDEKSSSKIKIFGSSAEVISSIEDNNCLIIGLKPTLEIQSDLRINLEEIQIVLEEKTSEGWEEVKKINLKIKEVEESSPRFL